MKKLTMMMIRLQEALESADYFIHSSIFRLQLEIHIQSLIDNTDRVKDGLLLMFH